LDENAAAALLDRRVTLVERAEIEQHLDDCSACRRLVALATDETAPSRPPPGEPPDGDLAPGDHVGGYRIERRLGAGAMGVVYAAEHVALRRPVALKVVRPVAERGGDPRRLGARLLREARAASAVRHPNVVTVHDVLTLADGSPVMVMDLLEGETLRRRLERRHKLGVRETVAVMAQVLRALEAAHAMGVVHRDLKPDNVFLVGDDVRLVDFGIAKLTSLEGPAAETAGLTETGMVVGTPHYMAPEQAFGEGKLDGRADLWSVGVMLYECLSGRLPIEERSVGAVMKALARLELTPIAAVAPELPAGLRGLIDALLVERSGRPGDAAEVRRRLEACKDADVRPGSAPADEERLAAASDTASDLACATGAGARATSRTRLWSTMGALSLVVAVASLYVYAAWVGLERGPTASETGVAGLGAPGDPSTPTAPGRAVVPEPAPAEPANAGSAPIPGAAAAPAPALSARATPPRRAAAAASAPPEPIPAPAPSAETPPGLITRPPF
jgi:serine/threonine-protein kinase